MNNNNNKNSAIFTDIVIYSDPIITNSSNITVPLITNTPSATDNIKFDMFDMIEQERSSTKTNNELCNNNSNNSNDLYIKKEKLLEYIKISKKKIDTSLFIISSKYDKIYYRYNQISLSILIISTIVTFIEAFKLTIVNFLEKNDVSLFVSLETITLIINIISLMLGTALTVLSSIVRFKNYREIMEKLKNIQSTLFNYKTLYNKQRDEIIYIDLSNKLTDEVFQDLQKKIDEYNKEIKEINIFEDIRITDLIKFNKNKSLQDIKIQKILKLKEIAIEKINNTKELDIMKIKNNFLETKKKLIPNV